MASVPRSAARRPAVPPPMASPAAMTSQSRDLSAARDSRRSGSSSAGVGVVAMAVIGGPVHVAELPDRVHQLAPERAAVLTGPAGQPVGDTLHRGLTLCLLFRHARMLTPR